MIFLLVNFACLKRQVIIIFHFHLQVYALILVNLVVGGLLPCCTTYLSAIMRNDATPLNNSHKVTLSL